MLLLGEPWIRCDLLGSLLVFVVKLDLDILFQAASLVIAASKPYELRVGDRHPHALKGQVDRSLLDDRVDIVSPRVIIEQTIHRQLVLGVEPIEHPPNSSSWLPCPVRDDAIVLLPKLVLVEPLPNGTFFHMQDELRIASLNLDPIRLDNTRYRIPCRTHL